MRFLMRGMVGLGLLALTAGLLVLAAGTLYTALEARRDAGDRPRFARERVFYVDVADVGLQTIRPVVSTFGEVRSGRTLVLRAATGGEIVYLAENFKEGGAVREGDILFQTDPATASANLGLAEAELEEARAELEDAETALALSRDDLRVSMNQLDLRQQALERQTSINARGVGTETALEAAKLAVSAAEQNVVAKRINLSRAKARVDQAKIHVARREITVSEARRGLSNTTVAAGFGGLLTEASAVLGGLVNANEVLGRLIDPRALEVAFRVSSREFQRIASAEGGLDSAKVDVTYGLDGTTVPARLDRVGAAVGEGRTGRQLFAKLGEEGTAFLRPGDFVSVRVEEPALQGVAVVPASAVSSTGELLVVGDGDRLEAENVRILRTQGDMVILDGGGLSGKTVVLDRAPQLAEGIRVQARRSGAPLFESEPMVTLSAAERDAIEAAVRANTRMPESARKRILARLAGGTVPKETAERLRAMAGLAGGQPDSGGASGNRTAAGQTVTLSDEDRQSLIAFVRSNTRMPEDRRQALLKALDSPEVPQEIVDRLRSRMGG